MAHGELDLSAALARDAISIASAAGCHWVHAYALLALGWGAEGTAEQDEPARCYEEGLAVARNVPTPLPFQMSTLLQSLAELAFLSGDLDCAETLCLEALAVLEPFGERYGAGFILRTVGWVRNYKGDAVGALDAWNRAFQASREVDDPWQVADSLAAFGRLAVDAGQPSHAARWLGAADALRERSGRPVFHFHDEIHQTIALARSRLGPEGYEAAWQAGSGLSPSHVWSEVQEARLDEVRPVAVTPPGSRLTPREHAVLDLLFEGKTDREIADEHFVGMRTVEGHGARILAKLGVRTRTAAVHAALAAGLVAAAAQPGTSR